MSLFLQTLILRGISFREQEHHQERVGVGMTLWPTGPARGEEANEIEMGNLVPHVQTKRQDLAGTKNGKREGRTKDRQGKNEQGENRAVGTEKQKKMNPNQRTPPTPGPVGPQTGAGAPADRKLVKEFSS